MASIEARTRILLYATLTIAIVALGATVYLFKSLNDAITQIEESQRALSSQVSSINYGLERVENATLDLNRLYESALGEISDLKKTLDELANKTKKLEEAMLFPITVVDATGDSITIPSKPLRIVSLLPSVTEILWSIGAEDQVVAVDEYSNYPTEVVEALKSGELTSIGSGWYPDVEAVLALNSDLVIGVDSVQSHHTLKKILADYGIPVLLLPDYSLYDVYESILLVGAATGHPVEAAKLVLEIRYSISETADTVKDYINQTGTPAQRVAILVWVYPLWVAGNNTWMGDLIKVIDGVNAYENLTSGWSAVDPESLLEARPDVILITTGHGSINMTRADFVDYLKGSLGEAVYGIPAIQNNRIYFIGGAYEDALVRPGPRVSEALRLLAVLIYPQAFGVNPSDIPELVTPETFAPP